MITTATLTTIANVTAIVAAVTAATAQIAGGIIGLVGDVRNHRQARANAEAEQARNEYNARIAEREAARVEKQNEENVRRQREAYKYLHADQRALLGKSGAAMESGSPLAVLGQTAADEELKIQSLAYKGYNDATQLREQAKMSRYQAAVARANKPTSGDLALNIGGRIWQMHGSVASTIGGAAYRAGQK